MGSKVGKFKGERTRRTPHFIFTGFHCSGSGQKRLYMVKICRLQPMKTMLVSTFLYFKCITKMTWAFKRENDDTLEGFPRGVYHHMSKSIF